MRGFYGAPRLPSDRRGACAQASGQRRRRYEASGSVHCSVALISPGFAAEPQSRRALRRAASHTVRYMTGSIRPGLPKRKRPACWGCMPMFWIAFLCSLHRACGTVGSPRYWLRVRLQRFAPHPARGAAAPGPRKGRCRAGSSSRGVSPYPVRVKPLPLRLAFAFAKAAQGALPPPPPFPCKACASGFLCITGSTPRRLPAPA